MFILKSTHAALMAAKDAEIARLVDRVALVEAARDAYLGEMSALTLQQAHARTPQQRLAARTFVGEIGELAAGEGPDRPGEVQFGPGQVFRMLSRIAFQAGDIDDVYRYHGIDVDSIVRATLDLTQ